MKPKDARLAVRERPGAPYGGGAQPEDPRGVLRFRGGADHPPDGSGLPRGGSPVALGQTTGRALGKEAGQWP